MNGFGLYSDQAIDFGLRYAPRAKCLYVNLPKAGCSSILWTLTRYELGEPQLLPDTVGTIHDRSFSPIKRGLDIPNLTSIMQSPDVVRFSIVRDPLSRVVSCFLNKIARATPQRDSALSALGQPAEHKITLAEFLDLVASQKDQERDPHWASQTYLLFSGIISLDEVGRFEHFDHDFKRIAQRISPDLPRFIYRERRHATDASSLNVSRAAKARIFDIYSRDYSSFGYRPPI